MVVLNDSVRDPIRLRDLEACDVPPLSADCSASASVASAWIGAAFRSMPWDQAGHGRRANMSSDRHRADFYFAALQRSSQPFAVGTEDGSLLDVNPAFERLTGYSHDELLEVNWATELTPAEWVGIERRALEALHTTGEPQLYEKEYIRKDGTRVSVEVLVHLSPPATGPRASPAHYFAFVTDISGRKTRESQQAFVSRMSEEIRVAADPTKLMGDVSRSVGRLLDVERCFFAEIVESEDCWRVVEDFHGTFSIAGEYRLSDYDPAGRETLRRGITEVVDDARTGGRSAQAYRSAYEPLGICSFVVVPLLSDGRWVGSFVVAASTPRHWRAHDVELLESVAARLWPAIEKLRLDAELRRSEAHFRELADAVPQIVFVNDETRADDVREREMGRVLWPEPGRDERSSKA